MPATGKGRWFRLNSKTTVEDSLKLPLAKFQKCFDRESSGTITWSRMDKVHSSIGYFIKLNFGSPVVTLDYRWRQTETVLLPINLESTPTQFGGLRWWFTCPLSVNGVACNRRVGTLYLSPGAKYFGCRHCHKLTYRSCQEAHQMERLFAQLGFETRHAVE